MKLDKYLRPEVQQFAVMMENRLRKYDSTRNGWKNEDAQYLFAHCIEELGEFAASWINKDTEECGDDAVDVANFLMMLVDRDELLEDFE